MLMKCTLYESERMKQIFYYFDDDDMTVTHLILIHSLDARKRLRKAEKTDEEEWFADVPGIIYNGLLSTNVHVYNLRTNLFWIVFTNFSSMSTINVYLLIIYKTGNRLWKIVFIFKWYLRKTKMISFLNLLNYFPGNFTVSIQTWRL